jgi:biopolymer transport protein ExbD
MAMTVGKVQGAMAEMNVVPLIDVLLVLLIIFMVIAPISPAGLRAQVPMPAMNAMQIGTPVVVEISADGSVAVNQNHLSWDSLGTRLSEIYSQRAEKVGFVRGESKTQFADIARAISVMRQSGITDVGLLAAGTTEKLPD